MRIIDGPIYEGKDTTLGENAEKAWEAVHRASGITLLNDNKCGTRRRGDEPVWTAERAEVEVHLLVARLNLNGAYPTQRQFSGNGLSGLCGTIQQRSIPGINGHREFAQKLGLIIRQREPWTKEEARTAVRDLVKKLNLGKSYPTQKQFTDNSLRGFYEAIQRRSITGINSHREFAKSLGLIAKKREPWTKDEARTAVRDLVKKLNLGRSYPTAKQFIDNDLWGPWQAINARNLQE